MAAKKIDLSRILSSNITILLLMTFVSVAVWRLNFYHYFWDEWDFVKEFAYNNFNFLLPHNEHFLPLFKLIYYLELVFFKNNPLWANYISLLAHASTGFVLYKVGANILKSHSYAILAALIYIVNPFHYATLVWNFQICTILNTLTFLLSIFFLQKYLENSKLTRFLISIILCFLQAYFFSTGLMLPLVCVAYYLLFRKESQTKYLSLAYLFIFILNIAIYTYFTRIIYTVAPLTVSLAEVPQILSYFLMGTLVNLSRPFPLDYSPSVIMILLSHTLFFVSGFMLWNRKKDINHFYKTTLFLAIFYLIPFFLISVGRFKFGVEQSFESRYFHIYFVPLAIYFSFFSMNILRLTNYKKAISTLLVIFLVFYFYLSIIEARSFKFERQALYIDNYSRLNAAMNYHDYVSDFSKTYPSFTTSQIRDLYSLLVGQDIGSSRNTAFLENTQYPFNVSFDLEPYQNNYQIVAPGFSFYQTFLSPYQKLNGIDLYLSTFYRKIEDPYTLLFYESDCKTLLYQIPLEVSNIRDNAFFRIRFPVITNSNNKIFCFTLKLETETSTTPVAIQLSAPDVYQLGDLKINDEYLVEDVVFAPFYQA
ncbi:MAG: hypothetical protein PHU71_01870 [Candidatus Gracilibacteria bacterium]|nr:hypothetical protein [Candidatus Gracilibacteria bacterium]